MKTLTTITLLFAALLCSHSVNAQINGDPMPFVKPQFFDNGGKPAAGYKLCTYATGTNNPTRTYTTSALSVPNPNPLILDSAGRASIFWPNVALKVLLLTDKSTTTDCLTGSQVTVWSVDNVETSSALIKTALAGSNGSSLVGCDQVGGTPTTVQAVLRRSARITDYGVSSTSSSTDQTTAIQAAITTAAANGFTEMFFPPGTYSFTQITLPDQFGISCGSVLPSNEAASTVTTLKGHTAVDMITTLVSGSTRNDGNYIQGCVIDGNNIATSGFRFNFSVSPTIRENLFVNFPYSTTNAAIRGGGSINCLIYHNQFNGSVAARAWDVSIAQAASATTYGCNVSRFSHRR